MDSNIELVKAAFTKLVEARNLPEILIRYEQPKSTYDVSCGGGDCEKHGRWYGVCHGCKEDMERSVRIARDEAHKKREENTNRAISELSEAISLLTAEPEQCEGVYVTEYDMEKTREIVTAYVMGQHIPEIVARIRHKATLDGIYMNQRAIEQRAACAVCGEVKHTTLRRDEMGGYVCLACIDKKLDATHVSDKRAVELRAQVETLREYLSRLSDMENSERMRDLANEALAATEPKP